MKFVDDDDDDELQVWKVFFSSISLVGRVMRLKSRTGTDGSPVSPINCDRPLYS